MVASSSDDDLMREHEATPETQVVIGSPVKRWLAIIVMGLIYNISLGGFLLVVSIINVINADLGPNPNYTWIGSAFTTTAGVGLLICGALSDRLGRRYFCIATSAFGLLGGIIGAVAKNIPTGKLS